MNLSIKGRTAVFSGGDSGITLTTAKVLAAEGVYVVLNDKTYKELEKAGEEARLYSRGNSSVITVSADLTKNEDAKMPAAKTKEQFGGADTMVNYAGIPEAVGDFLKLSDEDSYNTMILVCYGQVKTNGSDVYVANLCKEI